MSVQTTISPNPVESDQPWTIRAEGCPPNAIVKFDISSKRFKVTAVPNNADADGVCTFTVSAGLVTGNVKVTTYVSPGPGYPLTTSGHASAKVV